MAKVLYAAEAHVEGGRADGSQGGMEQLWSTHSTRRLSDVEVQALHRRVLAARDLDVDPDPTDIATVHKINADELARFDRSWDA